MLSHTPYDGSAQPFAIGLRPVEPARWLEIDRHYADFLAQKDRLIAERPHEVFAAEPGSEGAQGEVAALVADHLSAHAGTLFARAEDRDLALERLPALEPPHRGEPPLQAAARLVQEDLVLMRRGEDGWRLAAASLCFPSSWSLAEKFGSPLDDIHGPVPGFGRGTRPAELIARMFDRLQGQVVERHNWSLQGDAALFKPLSERQREDRAETPRPRFPSPDPVADAFIRVERQTLRKLPRSGDVLFTIRIHLDPMAVLRTHPDRQRLASGFADQLAALDGDQIDYKGLAADRGRLVGALRDLATN